MDNFRKIDDEAEENQNDGEDELEEEGSPYSDIKIPVDELEDYGNEINVEIKR